MEPLDLKALPLDSARWATLEHAYGLASDLPAMLLQLDALPEAVGTEEPWFSLWSALAHQGDVYSASFAAVPHVVQALARSPQTAHWTYFQFPAVVEAWRQERQVLIPIDLEEAYRNALAALPVLVGRASAREWDENFLLCALAALAAAKGFGTVSSAVLELTPAVAQDFMDWVAQR